MRIYSWNILYRNKKFDDAFEFISKCDFDIFCLQEVPDDFLTKLKTLPYSIAVQSERELVFTNRVVPISLVILSKHPIIATRTIPFPDYSSSLPLRSRLYAKIMLSRFFTHNRNRNGMYADISAGNNPLRVFNLHLSLGYPTWRAQEFEGALTNSDANLHTIVCGDFNVLEKPHITLLNWILGGEIRDAVQYKRERTMIEKRFVAHELLNPLRGEKTHTLSRSQLDHILVSNTFSISHASVLPDRMGSDHHPICVELIGPAPTST